MNTQRLSRLQSGASAAPRPSARRLAHSARPRQLSVVCRAAGKIPEHTEVEKAALQAYRRYRGSVAGKADALKLLVRAAQTKSVPAEVTEGALLEVELAAAQESSAPVPTISGSWHLVFGTATKFRPFQYIPIKENFVIDEASKTLALESALGPLQFFVRGVMSEWRPASAELVFQFNKVDVTFKGDKVWEVSPKTKPKTYTFFHVTPTLACARSSGGGVALMTR